MKPKLITNWLWYVKVSGVAPSLPQYLIGSQLLSIESSFFLGRPHYPAPAKSMHYKVYNEWFFSGSKLWNLCVCVNICMFSGRKSRTELFYTLFLSVVFHIDDLVMWSIESLGFCAVQASSCLLSTTLSLSSEARFFLWAQWLSPRLHFLSYPFHSWKKCTASWGIESASVCAFGFRYSCPIHYTK